jgi:hypothetical protein
MTVVLTYSSSLFFENNSDLRSGDLKVGVETGSKSHSVGIQNYLTLFAKVQNRRSMKLSFELGSI